MDNIKFKDVTIEGRIKFDYIEGENGEIDKKDYSNITYDGWNIMTTANNLRSLINFLSDEKDDGNIDYCTITIIEEDVIIQIDWNKVDGIVIKQNKVNRSDLDRLEPLEAVAFKPELEIAISKVLDIEWSLKGTLFSPVAIIEPVDLCGTTVSRASLSNINKMEELNIKIGSSVKVVKRGEIIPKIEGVV